MGASAAAVAQPAPNPGVVQTAPNAAETPRRRMLEIEARLTLHVASVSRAAADLRQLTLASGGDNEIVAGGSLGVELLKTNFLTIDLDARFYGLFGEASTADRALSAPPKPGTAAAIGLLARACLLALAALRRRARQ